MYGFYNITPQIYVLISIMLRSRDYPYPRSPARDRGRWSEIGVVAAACAGPCAAPGRAGARGAACGSSDISIFFLASLSVQKSILSVLLTAPEPMLHSAHLRDAHCRAQCRRVEQLGHLAFAHVKEAD